MKSFHYRLFIVDKLSSLLQNEIASDCLNIEPGDYEDAVSDFEQYIADRIKNKLCNETGKIADYSDEMSVLYGGSVAIANEIVDLIYLIIMHSDIWETCSMVDIIDDISKHKVQVTVELYPNTASVNTIFLNIVKV